MKPISYGVIKRIVVADDQFKNIKKEFFRRMNLFDRYPVAVDITLYGTYSFLVDTNEYEDIERTCDVPAGFAVRCGLEKEDNSLESYWKIIERKIIEEITLSVNEYWAYEWSGRWVAFKGIRFNAEKRRFNSSYIRELIAWDTDKVGIWHIEQECGAGWIVLPTKMVGAEARYTERDRRIRK